MSFAAICAAVTFALLSGFMWKTNRNLESELAVSREAVQAMSDDRDKILQSNATLTNKIENLVAELDSAKVKAGALFQENLLARKEISSLTGKMEEIQIQSRIRDSEIGELKRELVALKTNPHELLEQSNSRANMAEIDALQDEVLQLKADLLAYQNRLVGPVAENIITSHPMAKGTQMRGHILSVSPDNSVLAISLGSENGAHKSMRLRMESESGQLAQVEISKVEPQFSIGHILPGSAISFQPTKGQQISFTVQ